MKKVVQKFTCNMKDTSQRKTIGSRPHFLYNLPNTHIGRVPVNTASDFTPLA